MIQGSVHQEDTGILNVYDPNNRALNEWLELKGEINNPLKTSGNPNTPLRIDKTTGQEISKAVEGLNNTINPQDPFDA